MAEKDGYGRAPGWRKRWGGEKKRAAPSCRRSMWPAPTNATPITPTAVAIAIWGLTIPLFSMPKRSIRTLEGGACGGDGVVVGHVGGAGGFPGAEAGRSRHRAAGFLLGGALRRWVMQDATQWGLIVDVVDMRDLAALRSQSETRADSLGGVDRNAGQPALAHARYRTQRPTGA